MPGNTINEVRTSLKYVDREEISLDFTWSPGGDPGDPDYVYPNGHDSGAKKAAIDTAITFTAATRPGAPIASYEWNFGDGTTGHGPVVTHTFTVANAQLRVSLCIIDLSGRRRCVGHQMNLS